jgi:outer membrane lipopolysaccharide assembly protein LptE/RlpB
MRRRARWLLPLLLLSLAVGCGFQLRGSQPLPWPAAWPTVAITGLESYDPLLYPLQQAIERGGGRVGSEGVAQIAVTQASLSQRTTASDGSGRALGEAVTLYVAWSLRFGDGALFRSELRREREFNTISTNAIASRDRLSQISLSLWQEAAQQMVSHLLRHAPADAD